MSVVLRFFLVAGFLRLVAFVPGSCRIVTLWKTKVPSRMLAGYKLDLQRIFQTKLPTALLNFGFKWRVKNVSRSLRMCFVLQLY